MILVTADLLSFIKDPIDMVMYILGLLGVTSIGTVLVSWNYMNLMNPIRFTFEEIDRKEKYIFFNPFIKTVLLVLSVPISIGSGVLLGFFLYKNIELDTNEILTNTFFSGLTFLVLSWAIFFLFKLQEIIFIKKIIHSIINWITKNIFIKKIIHPIINWITKKYFYKKIIHPIINWIKKNIFFIKVLGDFFFQISITFIFLSILLYVYETKINISKKLILLVYILLNLIIFICIFVKIYYNYSSRVNLSYLYYLDKNGKKVFIFYKTNDMWICSKKDYILCIKTEKNEFYKKTSEYRNKAKKVNDSKVKEKILEYIDEIDKHSEYIRVDTPEVLKYFVTLNYCIENEDINSKKVELYKTIKKIIKMTEIKLIDQSDIPKDKLYPHTDNKDKFYSLLNGLE